MSPLLCLLLLATAATVSVHADCPSDHWITYNGMCYQLIDHLLTWHNASAACNSFHSGSTLASAYGPEQNAFLAENVTDYQEAWLGLRRPATHAAWIWSDGSPFDFSSWDWDQPEGEGEQCGMMVRYNDGMWVTELCGSYHTKFICQTQDA